MYIYRTASNGAHTVIFTSSPTTALLRYIRSVLWMKYELDRKPILGKLQSRPFISEVVRRLECRMII